MILGYEHGDGCKRMHYGYGYTLGTGQQVELTNFLAFHFDSDDL
jgi:hypothetical protein